MKQLRRNKQSRRLVVAFLASFIAHILFAYGLYLWMTWQDKDKDEEKELKPITPFEVSMVIEDKEDPTGEPLPVSDASIPTHAPSQKLPQPVETPDPILPETPPTPKATPTKKISPPKIEKPIAPTKPSDNPPSPNDKPKEIASESSDALDLPKNQEAKSPTRSTVFVDPTQKKHEVKDFRISGELFAKTFEHQHDSKLTQKLRGQKRFVGLSDQLEMAKVTLKNVSGGTIRPGNHRAIMDETAEEFLHRLHNYIHRQWALDYIPRLNMTGSHTDKINDLNLNAEIELVLDGATGKPLEVVIARSSGVASYDSQAAIVTKAAATTGPVPKSLWSKNGKVYIHWNYWRDQRQCGIFGANVYLLDEGGGREGSFQVND